MVFFDRVIMNRFGVISRLRSADSSMRPSSRLQRSIGLLVVAVATGRSPNSGRDYSRWATKLTQDLLEDYEITAPPTSDRSCTNLEPGESCSQAGTEVLLRPRFFKILNVDLINGQMSLKLWLRMSWYDTRLAWNPSEYGNITQLRLNAESFNALEVNQIWVPDITAYNSVNGLMHSFDASLANVYHDGSVFWSRPGVLHVMCRFAGLVMFPHDGGLLSCPIEFGGWASSGEIQGIVQPVDCEGQALQVATSGQEEVAMASYQEYSLTKITCERDNYYYASEPEVPWPVARYRVYLSRATSYYYITYLIPIILVTM